MQIGKTQADLRNDNKCDNTRAENIHNTFNEKISCKYKNMLQTLTIEMHDAGRMDDDIWMFLSDTKR